MQDAAASLKENHIPLTLNGWQSAAGWPDELLCPSVLSRVRLADPERLKTFLHDVVACLNESDDFLLLVSLATVAAAAAWWDDSVVQLLTLLQKETKSGAEVDCWSSLGGSHVAHPFRSNRSILSHIVSEVTQVTEVFVRATIVQGRGDSNDWHGLQSVHAMVSHRSGALTLTDVFEQEEHADEQAAIFVWSRAEVTYEPLAKGRRSKDDSFKLALKLKEQSFTLEFCNDQDRSRLTAALSRHEVATEPSGENSLASADAAVPSDDETLDVLHCIIRAATWTTVTKMKEENIAFDRKYRPTKGEQIYRACWVGYAAEDDDTWHRETDLEPEFVAAFKNGSHSYAATLITLHRAAEVWKRLFFCAILS